MGVGNYRDLIAWQRAMDPADEVLDATERWPRRQRFGLTNQARRAALSIQPTIAHRRHYLDAIAHARLLDRGAEVGRLLYGLLRSLRRPEDR